ncbi:iron ABC transporter permease [Pseudoalteromonas sp. MMG010]|uniref:ABC transporter permease n=1 Tax=Pseudoalteromonas sp. MMG010 TaxID=2822685 RepID=UPI001B3A1AF8|nr:iron ABC transporter permease [Pseudoalteromonas sp. MMG010]MBQ4832394.1 iron ABC transporter permease [Pseudoalteromonas sp. MMG010]
MRIPFSYPMALLAALITLTPVFILITLASDATSVFDSHNLKILGNTLSLMGLTVVGSILVGVPLAFISAYVQLPFKRLWLVIFAAPLAIPSYIGAFTLYAAFGPGGEINNLLGFSTPAMYGLPGAAIVMTLYTFPFVMMTTRSSLLSLDASMVNAARTLGMSMRQCVFKVILPRVINGIAAGSLLVALYTLSDFGTPAMMRLDTFTRVIYVEYNAFALGRAAMLSLQLMVIVGFLLLIESQIKTATERHGRPLNLFANKWQLTAIFSVFAPVLFLAIGLPLAIFFVWLYRDGFSAFDFTIAWNSAYASAIAAIVAVIVAIPVANAALSGKTGKVFERVTYFGFGIPGIVMGTALVYGGLQLPFLYQTLGLLIIAYMLRFLPLAVGSIRTSTEHLDPSLVKSARVLGASPREAFTRITLPLTMRGIIAGAALVFLESMRELEATLLLGPTGFETLSTYLWRVYEAGYFGRAAIPGLLLVLISACGLAIMMSGEKRNQIDH